MSKEELEKIIEENQYDPLWIGQEILTRLGYVVSVSECGVDVFMIRVYKPNGELVYINAVAV